MTSAARAPSQHHDSGPAISNTIAVSGGDRNKPSTRARAASPPDMRGEKPSQTGLTAADLCQSRPKAEQPMPMLEACLRRLPDLLAGRLRSAWKVDLGLECSRISHETRGADQNAASLPLLARFGLDGSPETGRLGLDSSAASLFLDALLGGVGASAEPVAREGFSQLDRRLLQAVTEQILASVTDSFGPVAPLRFLFQGWQIAAESDPETLPSARIVIVELVATAAGKKGLLKLSLPLAMLASHVAELSSCYPGEALGADQSWKSHLSAEMRSVEVELAAILYEADLPLGEIPGLEVGVTIPFAAPAAGLVDMRVGDLALWRGRLGRSGKQIAVRFESAAPGFVGDHG